MTNWEFYKDEYEKFCENHPYTGCNVNIAVLRDKHLAPCNQSNCMDCILYDKDCNIVSFMFKEHDYNKYIPQLPKWVCEYLKELMNDKDCESLICDKSGTMYGNFADGYRHFIDDGIISENLSFLDDEPTLIQTILDAQKSN